ncbi:MAG: class I SAM-dependent methyltransferase [Bradyrhizobium sp.]|uniref:class I SAM-dependent methyltransferase n=1 Tax=Bradyrhizobium sp. TaxID=376 RepID=UPI003536FC96
MGSNDKAFSGSIPYIYEQFMVPLIFAPYARDLAQRIAQSRPRKLLETAAGTGVLTRALAATLPAGAAITATDLNEPMLAQAKATLPDPRVEWRQADALALPFDDASFEVVACQFGVMFFPDRVKGHAEARRVLAPGGRLVFNTWERIEENEFPDVVMQALAEVFPHDPPRFMARTPHGYHDPDLIRSDLQRAGFENIEIDVVDHVSRAPSAREPAVAFCQGTPMRNEIEARGAPGLEAATDKAEEALRRRFGSGEIEGGIRALVVSAIAP